MMFIKAKRNQLVGICKQEGSSTITMSNAAMEAEEHIRTIDNSLQA